MTCSALAFQCVCIVRLYKPRCNVYKKLHYLSYSVMPERYNLAIFEGASNRRHLGILVPCPTSWSRFIKWDGSKFFFLLKYNNSSQCWKINIITLQRFHVCSLSSLLKRINEQYTVNLFTFGMVSLRLFPNFTKA